MSVQGANLFLDGSQDLICIQDIINREFYLITITINNNLTVPQATYITNPDNTITINPGTTQIIVTGTI